MYTVKFTSRFKKSYKLMVKQGKDISLYDEAIETPRFGKPLDAKYKDHQLVGNIDCSANATSSQIGSSSI